MVDLSKPLTTTHKGVVIGWSDEEHVWFFVIAGVSYANKTIAQAFMTIDCCL